MNWVSPSVPPEATGEDRALDPRSVVGWVGRATIGAVIIVSGALHVDEAEREGYLEGCVEVVTAARAADGCIDFHLSPDPIDPGRINVFEQWATVEAVEAFRGGGPSGEQAAAILAAEVFQHEVASTVRL